MKKNIIKTYMIYAIKCIKNNCIYIGCSKAKKHRITSHFSLLKKGTHTNKKLQQDYNKYGRNSFAWFKLDETIPEGKMFLEKYYIYIYGKNGNLYNKNNKCKPKDIRIFENIPLFMLKILLETDYLKT